MFYQSSFLAAIIAINVCLINCTFNYQPFKFTLNANTAELTAEVASPEINHCYAHTPTKTTKRTRPGGVLYFLIRTHVQNAFGKITNARTTVLCGSVIGCKLMRKARFWRAFSRSLCAVVRLWCHATQLYSTTERMTGL